MQVAGSASREHKHDSHNTESFNNNFRGRCVRRKPAGGLKTRDVFFPNRMSLGRMEGVILLTLYSIFIAQMFL